MVPKERLGLKESFFREEIIQSKNKHHITCSHNALGVSVIISSWDQFPVLHNDSSTASELSRKHHDVMSAIAERKKQRKYVQHQKIQSTEMPKDVILEL